MSRSTVRALRNAGPREEFYAVTSFGGRRCGCVVRGLGFARLRQTRLETSRKAAGQGADAQDRARFADVIVGDDQEREARSVHHAPPVEPRARDAAPDTPAAGHD